MFKKPQWSLKACKWWGGWSKGAERGAIENYLMDEISAYEESYEDQYSEDRAAYKHTTFMGEEDGDAPSSAGLVQSLRDQVTRLQQQLADNTMHLQQQQAQTIAILQQIAHSLQQPSFQGIPSHQQYGQPQQQPQQQPQRNPSSSPISTPLSTFQVLINNSRSMRFSLGSSSLRRKRCKKSTGNDALVYLLMAL
jgi:hypothetical protein